MACRGFRGRQRACWDVQPPGRAGKAGVKRTRRGCPRRAASETGGCTRAQGAATAQREFRSACRCWRNRKLENGCARRGGVWKGRWDLGSGHASLLSGFATQQPRDRDKAHPPVGLSTWKPEQPGATCLSSRFWVQPSGKQTPLMRPACTRPRPHGLTKSGVLPCARCVTPAGSAEASPGKHRAYHAKAGGEGGHELGKPRAGTCMVAQNRAAAPDPTAQFSGGLDS